MIRSKTVVIITIDDYTLYNQLSQEACSYDEMHCDYTNEVFKRIAMLRGFIEVMDTMSDEMLMFKATRQESVYKDEIKTIIKELSQKYNRKHLPKKLQRSKLKLVSNR